MIGVVLTLAVIGFLLWLITTYIPMNPIIRNVIIVFVVIAVVLWLWGMFGGNVGINFKKLN